jgi:hypothetical protein
MRIEHLKEKPSPSLLNTQTKALSLDVLPESGPDIFRRNPKPNFTTAITASGNRSTPKHTFRTRALLQCQDTRVHEQHGRMAQAPHASTGASAQQEIFHVSASGPSDGDSCIGDAASFV